MGSVQDIEIADKIEDTETVWRYMDFATFYATLQSKSLFFRRLDRYTDQYEGSLPEEVADYLFKTWSSFPLFGEVAAKDMINKFSSNLKQFNSGTLSNSWVLNVKEIYAMWKIYLRGSQEGVAIKTTVGGLRKSLSAGSADFTLAKVTYDILPWAFTDYKTLPSYKSKPYSYESELRILLYDQFEQESVPIDVFPKVPLHEDGASFPVELSYLIEHVYISPFAGKWFYDVIKSTVVHFMPSFNTNLIIKSRIKDR